MHLDLDHCGGIADFPEAQIHVMRPEVEGALASRTLAAMRRHPVTSTERGTFTLTSLTPTR